MAVMSLLLSAGISWVAAAPAPSSPSSSPVIVPWSKESFQACEGCSWQADSPDWPGLRMNAHTVAPPSPGIEWSQWIQEMRAYRLWVRDHLFDPSFWKILVDFQGVRSWIRMNPELAFRLDLAPLETLRLLGEARWIQGQNRVCMAFDLCDRQGRENGSWQSWSGIVASAEIPQDGAWHPIEIEVPVPEFDRRNLWIKPILGMDATKDPSPGQIEIKSLRMQVPGTEHRHALNLSPGRSQGFEDALYRREDLLWEQGNFSCGFLFVYDTGFWDPIQQRYRIQETCEDALREFNGYDSVVLWHAYPRIGADDRNQFDFFRDMPGGLPGLKEVVAQFHDRDIKVFLPYNPWDTGTRREESSDEEALADILAATGSDGLFLDTMLQATPGMREAVDRQRPGVVFEPEGHPSFEEMERCNGSWAQGLETFEGVGVLHLKWIEPRHMQHQIRRWDRSHAEELALAWLNGSGMLVWENVFGTWNPWRAEDRQSLRRMLRIQRRWPDLLSMGEWLPFPPTLNPGVLAGHWKTDPVRLWALVNRTGIPAQGPILDVSPRPGEVFYDLWNGNPMVPQPSETGVRLNLSFMEAFGAIVGLDQKQAEDPGFQRLLEEQRKESSFKLPLPDPHLIAQPIVSPKPPPELHAPPNEKEAQGLLALSGGERTFVVRHMQRECGCYPDPDVPREGWDRFLVGVPLHATLEHRIRETVSSCRIQCCPVTNQEYEAFLQSSGYRPGNEVNFLAHWAGTSCPKAIRSDPVVYVDLADARAYAAWAGMRLPTEWEWQQAGETLGQSFQRGEVWEWTESERDDGHTRTVMLRGGCRYQAQGSIWYFPGGEQPIQTHAKFILMYPGLDRCATIGFRCVRPTSDP